MISQEYNTNTTLVNFRIPITLKETFDKVCQFKTTNKTTVLVDYIKSFIDDEYPITRKEINNVRGEVDRFVGNDSISIIMIKSK